MELGKQLSTIEAETRLQDHQAIPLFREKERLQTELDALQAHCNWLSQELDSKSKDYQRLKQEARDRSLQFHLQLDQIVADKEDAQARLDAVEQLERDAQEKIMLLSKDLLQTKQELSQVQETSHELIQDERRLVQVQKEHLERWEQRYNDVVRQNETLKQTANQAMQQSEQEIEQIKADLETQYKQLLQEQADQYEAKLQAAAPPITTRQVVTVLENDEPQPMNMTDLYTAWQDTKVALQQEAIQRKHWQLQFAQVQKEIEDFRPTMLRQVKEYELALDRVQDYEQRLEQAVSDRDGARQDAQEARQEVSNLRKVIQFRKMECEELAKQVQTLLISRTGGVIDGSIPTSVQEMQSQNQRLLLEQRRLQEQVDELKRRLDTDELKRRLDTRESELDTLRRQQEEQQILVDQIVLQRDLYKSLLASKDQDFSLSQEDEINALEMVRRQADRVNRIENINNELETKLAEARAEANHAVQEKETMSERLARHEAQNIELRNAIDEFEKIVFQSKGEAARAKSEASYHRERCEHLESSLERARAELVHASNAKKELQKVNTGLQQSLSDANMIASHAEDEKRRLETNMRLIKTQLEVSKTAESRMMDENSQLRAELSRQGGITDAVRRIEESLRVKWENERESLKLEVQRLTSQLAEVQNKDSKHTDNLLSRIQESDVRIQHLESIAKKSADEAEKLKIMVDEAKAESGSLVKKCSGLEAQLHSAKQRLGESDSLDDSGSLLQAKIDSLESQLGAATSELASMKDRVKTYQTMSADNETSMSLLTKTIEELKLEKDNEITSLKQKVDSLLTRESQAQEVIKDLTQDLQRERDEHENLVATLRKEIETMRSQGEEYEKELSATKDISMAMKMELESLRSDNTLAHNNYARELELHSQARTLLREAREKAEDEKRQRLSTLAIHESFKEETELERLQWEEERKRAREALSQLEKNLSHSREQNASLHNQLHNLTILYEKLQASTSSSNDQDQIVDAERKMISELSETIRFLRSENELIQTQLDTAKRTVERERVSCGVLQRGLDEARNELLLLQTEKESPSDTGATDLSTKVTALSDQVKLLTDSNKLLRDELEGSQSIVSALRKELEDTKSALQPIEAQSQKLYADLAKLHAENESLLRDRDSWKGRVSSLVSKFNQIDPDEHKQLQDKLAAIEKEKESFQAWRNATEEDSARIRGIAKGLNQKLAVQKTQIEKLENDLQKLQEENSRITNASAIDAAAVKERDDLKAVVTRMKQDAESAKTELDGVNDQNGRLREILRKLQKQLGEAKARVLELESKITTGPTASEGKATASSDAENKGQDQEMVQNKDSAAESNGPQIDMILPSIPEGGFKFGPSYSKETSGVATKKRQLSKEGSSSIEPKQFLQGSEKSESESTKLSTDEGKTATLQVATLAKDDVTIVVKPTVAPTLEKTKELTMKERLIEKKRKLEEAMQRKRQAESGSLEEPTEADVAEKKAKVVAEAPVPNTGISAPADIVTTTNVSSEVSENKSEAETSSVVADDAVGDIAKPSEGVPMTNSSNDEELPNAEVPVFGQSSSVAVSGASGFGSVSALPASSSGSFLNIKPPGSSSFPSFSFGSPESIKLPMPSQSNVAPSPFGAFSGSSSFGLTFGTSPSTAISVPLFGAFPAASKDEKSNDGAEGNKSSTS